MNSQPIIIEQPYRSSSQNQNDKKEVGCKENCEQQKFYQVMDCLDDYDSKIKEMNDLYTEAMLVLANIKFNDPFTSLSIKGYKPSPAVLKLDENNKLIKNYTGFTNELDQDQLQYQEQKEIQKQCKIKHQSLSSQQYILDRFNVFSHKNAVIQASKKFRKLLDKILQITQKKEETILKFQSLEDKK